MTSKTETAKQLIVLATDGTVRVNERLAALEQADGLRKELKVGWAKLGSMDAKGVEEMRTDLKWACDAFEVRRMEPGTFAEWLSLKTLHDDDVDVEALGPVAEFEMSAEELADQALRPKAVEITEAEQRVMRCFRTYDTLEGTQSDCGVSWTDADELSRLSGLPVPTVKGVLGSLVQKGLVHADHEKGKPPAQCLTEEGAVVTHELLSQAEHQQDFVPPTVVSEPPKDDEQSKASEAPQALTAAERGAIGVMSRDLLQTDAPYEEIALAVRAAYPHARTTARSLASVAADMRRDGIPCPPRRKGGK